MSNMIVCPHCGCKIADNASLIYPIAGTVAEEKEYEVEIKTSHCPEQ